MFTHTHSEPPVQKSKTCCLLLPLHLSVFSTFPSSCFPACLCQSSVSLSLALLPSVSLPNCFYSGMLGELLWVVYPWRFGEWDWCRNFLMSEWLLNYLTCMEPDKKPEPARKWSDSLGYLSVAFFPFVFYSLDKLWSVRVNQKMQFWCPSSRLLHQLSFWYW